jgi:hypothetical protein
MDSPPGQHHELSVKGMALQKHLNLLGVILLSVGLVAAGWICWDLYQAPDAPPVVAEQLGTGSSHPIAAGRSSHPDSQSKKLGDEVSDETAEFTAWFGSLWQGRRLAYTLAVLSLGGCLLCFFLAQQLPD